MDAFVMRIAATQLARARTDRAFVAGLVQDPQVPRLELGQSWAALHFLLSAELPIPKQEAEKRGLSWDVRLMDNVLMGGDVTPFRGAFGPARLLPPAQVAHHAAELRALGAAEVIRRYDARSLTTERIPPGDWEDEAERRTWLEDRLSALIDELDRASSAGDGVLVWMR